MRHDPNPGHDSVEAGPSYEYFCERDEPVASEIIYLSHGRARGCRFGHAGRVLQMWHEAGGDEHSRTWEDCGGELAEATCRWSRGALTLHDLCCNASSTSRDRKST